MGNSVPRGQHLGSTTLLQRWIGPIAVLAAFAGGTAWAAPSRAVDAQQGVDPKARALLERMSNFLASQPQLSVQTDGSMEVVLKTGEKVEFEYSSDVRLKRPDKLRSDRRGEKADVEFYYDGRSFTLYGMGRTTTTTRPPPRRPPSTRRSMRRESGWASRRPRRTCSTAIPLTS
jgi:hypothetical protein